MNKNGVSVKVGQEVAVVHVAFQVNLLPHNREELRKLYAEGKIKVSPDRDLSSAIMQSMTWVLQQEFEVSTPFKVHAVYLETSLDEE